MCGRDPSTMRLAIYGRDPEVRAPDPRRAGQVGQVGFGRHYKAVLIVLHFPIQIPPTIAAWTLTPTPRAPSQANHVRPEDRRGGGSYSTRLRSTQAIQLSISL